MSAHPHAIKRHRLRLDVALPDRGLARWSTVAALVLGGIVAILIPLVCAAVLWSLYVK